MLEEAFSYFPIKLSKLISKYLFIIFHVNGKEIILYSQWFSTRRILSPRGHLAMSGDIILSQLENGEFATGIYWGETRDDPEVINHWVQLKRNTIFPSQRTKINVSASF